MKANYLLILSLCFLFSCQRQESIISKFFDKQEITEIDKLIQYYDQFIQKLADNKGGDLARSYLTFLQVNTIMAQQGRDMDVLRPSLKSQIDLFNTINPDFIEEIYQKKAFDQNLDTYIEDSNPPLHFNPKGKFALFIQELAKKNSFFSPIAKELEEKGDIGEQSYHLLLDSYPQINFKNKDERFAFIACMLRRA